MNDELLQRLWDYQPEIEESIQNDLDRKELRRTSEASLAGAGTGAPGVATLVGRVGAKSPSGDDAADGDGGGYGVGGHGVGGYGVGGYGVGGGHGTSRRTLLLTAAAGFTVLGGIGWALVDRDNDNKRTAASGTTADTSVGTATDAARPVDPATSGDAGTAAATDPSQTTAQTPVESAADSTTAPTDPDTVPPTDAATAPPETLSPNMVPAVDPAPLGRTLKEGNSGSDVTMLQQRLRDLHLETGSTSGTFNHLTTQAVWAFQKLVMQIPAKQATGTVTPAVWTAMQNAVTYTPRKNAVTNTHVEVYVPEQVMVVFKAGAPVLVSHVSTGSGKSWKAAITLDPGTPDNPGATPVTQHILGTSITPGGSYKFVWRFTTGDGWRVGKLGRMYKPVYFNQGVAVHGMTDVPNYPASHGCVRLPMGVTDGNNEPKGPNPADIFPTLVSNGDQIFVFTDANTTAQGNEAPPYDKPDPAFTTTTSPATSPPATAGSTAPKTTAPAPTSTTAKPPETTTTAAPTTTVAAATTTTQPAAPPPSA